MNIGIVLVHNKSNAQNIAQIEDLKLLLNAIIEGPFIDVGTGESWTTEHHELIGLVIPHQVKVYQIIPFGVTPPPNRYEINSGGIVYYGKGDEDKIGNHPRFFNWGLKRATDQEADLVIYLDKPNLFNLSQLITKLEADYSEELFGRIASLNLLRQVGQLKEDVADPLDNYRNRIIEKGLNNG